MTTILLPDTARMQIEQTFLDAVTQSSKVKMKVVCPDGLCLFPRADVLLHAGKASDRAAS